MTAHPDVNAQAYIKEHFQKVLGKIYAPYSNKNVLSLALDKEKSFQAENEALLAELEKHFYVKGIKIGENPTEKLEYAKTEGVTPSSKQRDGVLMVMMEHYAEKSSKFMSNGSLAIGIKYTKDSMEIVEHLSNIGYILFHTRKDEGQHLFAIEGNPEIKSASELEESVYRNTTGMYVLVHFNPQELDSTAIHSAQKGYASSELRYDAQYARLEELK